MNIYTYLAETNPSMAKAICHKYGYTVTNVRNSKDLGVCLEKLVSEEGEEPFKDVVRNHPDKDVILEVCAENYVKKVPLEPYMNATGYHNGCQCPNCRRQQEFVNYSGAEETQQKSNFSTSQANIFIMASALILAVAIVSTNR